ncbi:MAG: hypothetical protein SP1CHLAM54_10830 [Chlamydiia bacterium]|nr:hypothetical protein [Chlamydiia bacterium]MCH9615988.1 hypothetical protein [Chlamydiia bacterium]MCH9629011.1 hypothetical protein [Chlamydiia bacterium]
MAMITDTLSAVRIEMQLLEVAAPDIESSALNLKMQELFTRYTECLEDIVEENNQLLPRNTAQITLFQDAWTRSTDILRSKSLTSSLPCIGRLVSAVVGEHFALSAATQRAVAGGFEALPVR